MIGKAEYDYKNSRLRVFLNLLKYCFWAFYTSVW